MTEIKFRIWHEEYKKFHYVRLINYLSCKGVLDYWSGCEDGIWEQFTGLLDKNGKEIYENDIVKYGLQIPGKGVVFFRNGCYFIQSIEEEWCPSLVSESFYGKLEVIGNTFENHEIIKRWDK